MKLFFTIFFFVILFSCSKEAEFNNEERRLLDSIQKYSYNEPDRVILFLHQFINKTKKEKNKRYMYGALALNYKMKNDTDSTLYYLHKGLSTCKELRDIINYKYEIGLFCEERYNYEDALLMYKQCYDLAKKEKSLEELQKIEYSLKLLKNKVLQSEEALLFLENDYNKEKNKATIISDKNIRYRRKNLIKALIARKHLDKALSLINEGLEEANKRNNTEFLFFLFKLKAETYIEKGEIEQAIKANAKALFFSEELKNQKFINEANYILAQIKAKLNKPDKAISLIENIIATNEEKSEEELSGYYKILAACYEKIDSTSISIGYYKKHDIQKGIVTDKRIALIDNIDKIGLDEAILERKKQESKTMYWNIAFIILFLFGLTLFIRNRKVQKNNQKKFNDLMLKIDAREQEKHQNTVLKSNVTVPKNESVVNEKAADTEAHLIDDERVREILIKIKALEEKEFFLRKDCTLHNMAKKLKTNTTYLSKIFNNHLGKTFSSYLNDLRINYIILELKNNKKIRAYSAKAISEDLGYKTVDSFSKYFKQATGITPSVYIKKLQKES